MPAFPEVFAIIGMKCVDPAESAVFLPTLTGKPGPGRLRCSECPARISGPGYVRNHGNQTSEAVCSVTDCQFCSLDGIDVLNHAQGADHFARLIEEGRRTDSCPDL